MSRDPVDDPVDDPGTEDRGPSGRVRRTGPGPLVALATLGLVLGWSIRPVTTELGLTTPQVAWLQAGSLYFIAAVLGLVARATDRVLHRDRGRLEPHQAVNRLVLAKSCAVAAALLVGGYLGYALSFVDVGSRLEGSRILRSLVAALGAVLVVGASLWLERACQVRDGDDEP
jgi:hypothetical protein